MKIRLESGEFVRHGDLRVTRIDQMPANVKQVEGNVLAEGEVTGHFHRLEGTATLYKSETDELFFQLMDNCMLNHEEHNKTKLPNGERTADPIQLEPGVYKVQRQDEYDQFEGWEAVRD